MSVQPDLYFCRSCRHRRASAHHGVVVGGIVKDQDCVLWDVWNQFPLYPSLEILVVISELQSPPEVPVRNTSFPLGQNHLLCQHAAQSSFHLKYKNSEIDPTGLLNDILVHKYF